MKYYLVRSARIQEDNLAFLYTESKESKVSKSKESIYLDRK